MFVMTKAKFAELVKDFADVSYAYQRSLDHSRAHPNRLDLEFERKHLGLQYRKAHDEILLAYELAMLSAPVKIEV